MKTKEITLITILFMFYMLSYFFPLGDKLYIKIILTFVFIPLVPLKFILGLYSIEVFKLVYHIEVNKKFYQESTNNMLLLVSKSSGEKIKYFNIDSFGVLLIVYYFFVSILILYNLEESGILRRIRNLSFRVF